MGSVLKNLSSHSSLLTSRRGEGKEGNGEKTPRMRGKRLPCGVVSPSLDFNGITFARSDLAEAIKDRGLVSMGLRFENCGLIPYVYECSKCGRVIVISNSCDNLFCPKCLKRRLKRLSDRYGKILACSGDLKFLTLTFKRFSCLNDVDVKDLRFKVVKFLRETFGKWYYRRVFRKRSKLLDFVEKRRDLRRKRRFRRYSFGCLYNFEFVFHDDGGGVYVHSHVLVKGIYIPQEVLSKKWFEISGDSSIVFVKKAKNEHFYYLTKYCSKEGVKTSNSVIGVDVLADFVFKMYNRRRVSSLGDFYGVVDDGEGCSKCGGKMFLLGYGFIGMLFLVGVEKFEDYYGLCDGGDGG